MLAALFAQQVSVSCYSTLLHGHSTSTFLTRALATESAASVHARHRDFRAPIVLLSQCASQPRHIVFYREKTMSTGSFPVKKEVYLVQASTGQLPTVKLGRGSLVERLLKRTMFTVCIIFFALSSSHYLLRILKRKEKKRKDYAIKVTPVCVKRRKFTSGASTRQTSIIKRGMN